MQLIPFRTLKIATLAVACSPWLGTLRSDDSDRVLPVKDSIASNQDEMKKYVERIEHTNAKIEMIPIAGGKFLMGSPDTEADRNSDEGPVHPVEIAPFWMAKRSEERRVGKECVP